MNSRQDKLVKVKELTPANFALYFGVLAIGLYFVVSFGLWWFQFTHIPSNFSGALHVFDFLAFLLLSYVVWYQIINEVFMWVTALFMRRPQYMKPQPGMKVAFLTAFVPGSEPYNVLEKTLSTMTKVDYPHDTWLLDEGNDPEAKRICEKYGVKHYSRNGIAKYNMTSGLYKAKTKAGNYNSWYDINGDKYEIVAQIDVDFVPKMNFLTKTLGYFRDRRVAFVGTPQIYGNTDESWIAQGAAEQAYGFYGTMQKGFFGHDMQLFIGANHVVRVAAHNAIDGYSGHIVEDHLTGMKFYSHKWKSVYVPEVLAIGEGPATWDAYFSQQMRWAYGLIDILFTQSPKLFRKMSFKHIVNYYLLQQYYFFGITQVIGVILLSLYFFFGYRATDMKLEELLYLYPPILIWQQVIFLWLQKYNVDPVKETGLMLRAKILNIAVWPIYFMALLCVLGRKPLTYKVTPKGENMPPQAYPGLFIPHLILGSITAIDLAVAMINHHDAIQLVFWAAINTLFLYFFVFNENVKKLTQMTKMYKNPFAQLPRLRFSLGNN